MSAQIIRLPPRPRPPVRGGLSDQECFAIAAGLHALPGWSAQRDEEPDGSVVMALVAAEEEEAAPVFVVRRDAAGFRRDSFATCRTLGRYGSPSDLMGAARHLLESGLT